MNLNPIKANMTELRFERNGLIFYVLFSYKTPVAYLGTDNVYRKTTKKWSNTTTRHVNQWLDGNKAYDVDQSELDNLIAGVK